MRGGLAERRRQRQIVASGSRRARAAMRGVGNGAAVEEAVGDLLAASAPRLRHGRARRGGRREARAAFRGRALGGARSSGSRRPSSASRGADMRSRLARIDLRQPAGAAEPSPPAAGQAERAKQRIEHADVAEADGRAAPAASPPRRRWRAPAPRRRPSRGRCGRYPRSRSPAAPASPGRGGGRRGPHRRSARGAGVRSQVLEADGDGEVGPERQPLALRPFGHEHSSADVLARGFEERVGRVEHGHVDEARPGGVVEGAEAGGERGRSISAAQPYPLPLAGRGSPAKPRPGEGSSSRGEQRPHPAASPATLPRKGEGQARCAFASGQSQSIALSSNAASTAAFSLRPRCRRAKPRTGRGAPRARPDGRRSPPPAPCRRRDP